MRRAIAGVAVAALGIMGLAACSSTDDGNAGSGSASPSATQETSAAPETTPAEETSAAGGEVDPNYKACMVSDAGGFDDKSFNQSGYEGLEKAVADLGIQEATVESQTSSDFAPNIQTMLNDGCNVIVTVGFMLNDATREAAGANTDTKFAIVDTTLTDANGDPVSLDNVRPLVFNTAEADFMAGYLAAATTKTGKVGTFGGMQIPSVTIFMDGFVDGVKYYNEQKGTNVEVLGWNKDTQQGQFTGDFDDVSKGKALSESLINQGADIIHPVAGPVGDGALAAAKDAGDVLVIWVDADGYETNPDYGNIILSSVVKEIGAAVFDTIEAAAKGSYDAASYVGTLENGGVSLAPFHDLDSQVSAETKAELEQIKADIISGKIKVESPSTPTAS